MTNPKRNGFTVLTLAQLLEPVLKSDTKFCGRHFLRPILEIHQTSIVGRHKGYGSASHSIAFLTSSRLISEP